MARTPTDMKTAARRGIAPNVSRTGGMTRVGPNAGIDPAAANEASAQVAAGAALPPPPQGPSVFDIARVCHTVNKALCEFMGDMSQPDWQDAPDWQKDSAVKGVQMHLNEDVGPEASHEAWCKEKLDTGWVYGEVKDPEAKTHPCLVPFDQLPKEQQLKDHLFRAVVHGFK